MTAVPDIHLHVDVPRGEVRAAVLIMHGGAEFGRESTSHRQPSVLRLLPLAWSLRRAGRGHGLAVWRLRYRVRGWNGAEQSPVADAREALARIEAAYAGVPIALVGYSMGGRTAMHVADDPAVTVVVALAPWLTPIEPVDGLTGRHVLFAHGTEDTQTDPRATAAFAQRARPLATSWALVAVRGDTHALLRRARLWHRLTTRFVLDRLGLVPLPASLAAIDAGDGAAVEL